MTGSVQRVPVRPALCDRAAQVAVEVGRRVADPAILSRSVEAASRQSAYADLLPWRPMSVAQGFAGAALLSAALDAVFPGQGWDRVGHRQLRAAADEMAGGHHADPSLYGGVAGLGLAAVNLARGRSRYARLLAGVDAALLPLLPGATSRLDAADGCAVARFDLISGLAGTGAYLLSRRAAGGVDVPLREVLGALGRLLASGEEPPRWHTPAHLAGELLEQAYPYGVLNCGLAHGMPGPLALLAAAALEGVVVEQTQPALRRAARWLVGHTLPAGPVAGWPNAVSCPGPELPAPATDSGRDAWCYGTPGVARALWLAGQALGDAEICDVAVEAIRGVAARSPAAHGLSSPTFCHGTAGLLQILLRFAGDTGLPDLADAATGLLGELLEAYEPDSILGYRNVEPDGALVDHPGLLDGAPGVALALLTATGRCEPTWDRLFLLS